MKLPSEDDPLIKIPTEERPNLCPDCDGEGSYEWAYGIDLCKRCNGSGLLSDDDITLYEMMDQSLSKARAHNGNRGLKNEITK